MSEMEQNIQKLLTQQQKALEAQNRLLNHLWYQNIISQPEYQDPRRLTKYGHKFFSQNDEDGIIIEIFNRISFETKCFFEFGVHPMENNTVSLLAHGFHGYWLDVRNYDKYMDTVFKSYVASGTLKCIQGMITKENALEIFKAHQVPENLDLLSIDIDGNDYYVWKALAAVYKPRVVVIEYNASYPASVAWVQPDDPNLTWSGSNYFGSSLKAQEILGRELGYSLVGTSVTGINAFFVRNDLLQDRFCPPYTAENHFSPPRYGCYQISGHRADFGPFEDPSQHFPSGGEMPDPSSGLTGSPV